MSFRLLAVGSILLAACTSTPPASPPDPGPPPPPAQSIYDVVSDAPDLSAFAALLDPSGLDSALRSEGPVTLFAPSNDAMAALPAGTVDRWLLPEQRDELANRLSRHLVPGRIASSDLRDGLTLRTLSGETLRVRITNGQVFVGSAMLVTTNVEASNGLVHVTDALLSP